VWWSGFINGFGFAFKKQRWQPIGVLLKYAVWRNKTNLLHENVCRNSEPFKIARDICKKLKVPYHIFDATKKFKKVVGYFIDELKKNKTPNPCGACNRYLKFNLARNPRP
jgi:tRNA-specific 2-thiouridylase